MTAWWEGTVAEFQQSDDDIIVGMLTTRAIQAHPSNYGSQLDAWRSQLPILRDALAPGEKHWRLLIEYPLLRLGKRIDSVLLTDHAIIVLEFKVGATSHSNADRRQVEDYALDLADFHACSRHHPIVPILVATAASPAEPHWCLIWHHVTQVFDANAVSLGPLLNEIVERIPASNKPLGLRTWAAAPYRPVPTIVDAARLLYGRHGVGDIAAARADVGNLTRTTDAIANAVAQARQARQHHVVFVTGIPGAGKTLCGLNAVFGTQDGAAFLTGNLPLVHVIRAALVRDARSQGRSTRVATQETESAIQPLNGFLHDNHSRLEPPHEHVIVFDEAQRAWDADYGARKFKHAASEAAMFLDIMHRHKDWAVIIALVGSGQEINTGEAGLEAWGEALQARPDWHIWAPPNVLAATDIRQPLFASAPPTLRQDNALHLNVPVRSIHSTSGARWVDAILTGNQTEAKAIANEADGVPFRLTRSLSAMRSALRDMARGNRRAGLVCSAAAKRLRADGLPPGFPHLEADTVAHWFLQQWPDVRASDALEVPATQFACQGLELDYVGLCWGNDLIRRARNQDWIARNFAGTNWQVAKKESVIAYRVNTYRVLLTRARYTSVVWVPKGDPTDRTREPAIFDAIAEFLLACGISPLDDTQPNPTPTSHPMLLP